MRHWSNRGGLALVVGSLVLQSCRAPGPPVQSQATRVFLSDTGCTIRSVSLKSGICRVHGLDRNDDHPRHTLVTVPCGQKSGVAVCGEAFTCDCSKAVEPYPCDRQRPENWPWKDGTYSESEYGAIASEVGAFEEMQPAFQKIELDVAERAEDGALLCEVRARKPRYGECFVEGARSAPYAAGGGFVADFIDRIAFGETKVICGREMRCACE